MSREDSQTLIQTLTSVVTFLLVALLQNSQHRSEQAVNLKLNAIAHGIADLMRHHNGDDKDLTNNVERLAESVGLEERITTARRRKGTTAGSDGASPATPQEAEATA